MLLAINWIGHDCVLKFHDPAQHHVIDGTSMAKVGPVPMAAYTVRKLELRKARKEERSDLIEMMDCKQRFILLKNKGNLTGNQKERLDRLCSLNESIYKAMLLKESFLLIYTKQDETSAEECLNEWFAQAATSGIQAFVILAEKFKNKARYILNWFKKRISSAISEGINNKIKRLKRMAYGYRNVRYFLLKIHQHCGLLSPRFSP